MLKIRSIILLLAFTITGISVSAQDFQISQYYASPLNLNPALTGAFDGTYRVFSTYRDQLRGALENPFQTFIIGGDVRFMIQPKSFSKDAAALGLIFKNDNIGDFGYTYNSMALSGAYHKFLSNTGSHSLSAGFQVGVTQRSISYESLSFHDQFNGVNGYTLPSAESLPPNNLAYFDLGVGLNYMWKMSKLFGFYAGGAMQHILTPNVSWYNLVEKDIDILDKENKLFYKMNTYAGLVYDWPAGSSLYPRVLFSLQGPHMEIVGGANYKYQLPQRRTALHAGLMMRATKDLETIGPDAVIPFLGFEYDSLLIGMSYDLSLRSFTSEIAAHKAFEITIRYIGEHDNEDMYCPSF